MLIRNDLEGVNQLDRKEETK